MTFTNALAYLIRCASKGIEAKIDEEFDAESDRVLQADSIRHLMLGLPWTVDVHQQVHHAYEDHRILEDGGPVPLGSLGLRLRGAIVKGKLDLSNCGSIYEPLPSLSCTSCIFEHAQGLDPTIDLSNAHLCGLNLARSKFRHLRGVGMRVTSSLDLCEISPANGTDSSLCWCKLSRASIDGNLLADGAQMHAPANESIGELSYYDFFEVNWAINLCGSQIAGSIMMRGKPKLDGGVLMDFACVQGDVRITGAYIASLRRQPAIALERARIDGNLTLAGVQSEHENESLDCKGTLWLMQAKIGGSLDIHGANLNGGHMGVCLYAIGINVDGWLSVGQQSEDARVIANGRFWLQYSQVGGELILANVDVTDCEDLEKGLRSRERGPVIALNARGARANNIRLSSNNFKGGIELSDARCTTLIDDLSGYGQASPILIDGFQYERLENHKFGDKDRKDSWLPGEHGYHPQPYVQLAHVLANDGNEALARDVLVRKAQLDAILKWRGMPVPDDDKTSTNSSSGVREVLRRARRMLARQTQKIGRQIVYGFVRSYGALFDFGLSPSKAAVTMLVFILVGWGIFQWMDLRRVMVVAQQPVASVVRTVGHDKFVAADKSSPDLVSSNTDIPCGSGSIFRWLLYAADVFIPLVDLREEGKCDIDLATNSKAWQWEVTGYRILKAVYAILGWVVTTLALLTFSGIIRHRLFKD